MTYNPNSAFPRQATYVSGFHHQIRTQQAINAPDYNPKGAGSFTFRSLAGDYANIARQSAGLTTGWGASSVVSSEVNRQGLMHAVHSHRRSLDALKRANKERGEERMQKRFEEHYPGDPTPTVQIGEKAGEVLDNKPKGFETPIKVPGFNENLTAPRPMKGRRIKPIPGQEQLFSGGI